MRSISVVIVLFCASMAAGASEPVNVLEMKGVENAYPRWSKDGSKILFQSNRGGTWQIYVMDRNGQNQRQLTTGGSNNNLADWSPDNSRIAFVSDRTGNEEIFIMNMDGSGLRNLTNNRARDIHPYWTPDGRYLLFNSNREDSNFDIYLANVDLGSTKRITSHPDEETCARLSPDGKHIVFLVGDSRERNDEVYVMDADGSNRRNITKTRAGEGWPSWSPDGNIIFASDESGRFSLYTMAADGSNRRRLTTPPGPYRDGRPVVSRDGSSVVFNRQAEGTIAIYTMQIAP